MSIAAVGHITYKGEKVEIAQNGQFYVAFHGDAEDYSWFSTFEAAQAAIDGRIRKDSASRRIDVPVLDNDGASYTLTGYHAGHGKALVKGWGGRGELFVDTPDVHGLLKKSKELRGALDATEKALKRYRIPERAGTYGTPTQEAIEKACDRAEAAADVHRKVPA